MRDTESQSFLRAWTADRSPAYAIGMPRRSALPAGDGLTIGFTSQRWRDSEWRHELRLYRPTYAPRPGRQAFLFLSGGDRSDAPTHANEARRLDGDLSLFTLLAQQSGSVVGVLSHALHQPMFGGLGEHHLIAHTFDRYLDGEREDWPILLPMTAAVRRAMDVAQHAAADAWNLEIERFTLAGFSKRGWAGWLAAAVDPRVTGLAPIMMDLIDLPRQFAHQLAAWGSLSTRLAPFEALDIPRRLESIRGEQLLDMVDPVRWDDPGTVRRLVISASNDEYTPVDAPNLFLDRFAGPAPWSLIPNSRHGSLAFPEIVAAASVLHRWAAGGATPPQVVGRVNYSPGVARFALISDRQIASAVVWIANARDADLREVRWSAVDLDAAGEAEIALPAGRTVALFGQAFFSQIGDPAALATRVFVTST